jgi:hypothetical protein
VLVLGLILAGINKILILSHDMKGINDVTLV